MTSHEGRTGTLLRVNITKSAAAMATPARTTRGIHRLGAGALRDSRSPLHVHSGARDSDSVDARRAPNRISSSAARHLEHSRKCVSTWSLSPADNSPWWYAERCRWMCLLNILILPMQRLREDATTSEPGCSAPGSGGMPRCLCYIQEPQRFRRKTDLRNTSAVLPSAASVSYWQ